MNQTPNYQLSQWEATDQVLRADFNGDNAKIDAALGGLETVKGNCEIVTGSYVGTGTYGKNKPCTLTFDRKPLIVFLNLPSSVSYNGSISQYSILFRGVSDAMLGDMARRNATTWGEQSVSWYNLDNSSNQFNNLNTTYTYIALLA